MKLVVLTDIHANLPALDAALAVIQRTGYDLLVHMGDVITIGPQPAECLARLLALPNARYMMGNHDAWFAFGLPQPQPSWMSDGEVAHQQWTHAQLDPGLRAVVSQWPYVLEETLEGVPVTFLHYGLTPTQDGWPRIIPQPTNADLDTLFAGYAGQLIFYGHHHPFADHQGRARYINPGSLGCHTMAAARYTTVDLYAGQATVAHHNVPYEDAPLFAAFETRQVPERKFLYKAFFGGRFL